MSGQSRGVFGDFVVQLGDDACVFEHEDVDAPTESPRENEIDLPVIDRFRGRLLFLLRQPSNSAAQNWRETKIRARIAAELDEVRKNLIAEKRAHCHAGRKALLNWRHR